MLSIFKTPYYLLFPILTYRLRSIIEITIEGKVVLFENLDLQSTSSLSISDKVGGVHIFGSLILVGPDTKTIRDDLASLTRRQTFHEIRSEINSRSYQEDSSCQTFPDPLISISALDTNISVVRFAGNHLEDINLFLAKVLEPLKAKLGDVAPYADRIHGTVSGRERAEGI